MQLILQSSCCLGVVWQWKRHKSQRYKAGRCEGCEGRGTKLFAAYFCRFATKVTSCTISEEMDCFPYCWDSIFDAEKNQSAVRSRQLGRLSIVQGIKKSRFHCPFYELFVTTVRALSAIPKLTSLRSRVMHARSAYVLYYERTDWEYLRTTRLSAFESTKKYPRFSADQPHCPRADSDQIPHQLPLHCLVQERGHVCSHHIHPIRAIGKFTCMYSLQLVWDMALTSVFVQAWWNINTFLVIRRRERLKTRTLQHTKANQAKEKEAKKVRWDNMTTHLLLNAFSL